MAKWEIAIACKDEDDLPSGHKRKKEGDIIAVKPYPWQWGNKEVNSHLIVIADNLTEQEAHSLCQPYYEGGVLPEDIIDDTPPPVVSKRRHSIPLNILKDGWNHSMIEADVRDADKVYQPLRDNDITIDFSEKVSICKDKHKNSYRYSKLKGSV